MTSLKPVRKIRYSVLLTLYCCVLISIDSIVTSLSHVFNTMGYLCHSWSRIYYVCRRHKSVCSVVIGFSTWIAHTKGATSEAGISYPFDEHAVIPGCSGICVAQSMIFCKLICLGHCMIYPTISGIWLPL